jgi:site-specific DNA-methyltransferase (adenine-specific)
MSLATWITGDTLTVLQRMPDNSVDLVMTSPPFLALRSYLPDDDPAKVHEIGQEPTPGEFIDALVEIIEELRRVVAPHGSICVELGDTYCGAGGYGSEDAPNPAYSKESHNARMQGRTAKRFKKKDDGWPESKSLCLTPELFRITLTYGFNPLTGRPTPRWRTRNVIRWVRPNPPVGALGDKFRPGTSEMVVLTGTDEAGRTRYFDLDAVRYQPTSGEAGAMLAPSRSVIGYSGLHKPGAPGASDQPHLVSNPAGAPPLDWWNIPTAPYKGSHYATFPPALVDRPVRSMCPQRVCTTCGEPSRRITSEPTYVQTRDGSTPTVLDMRDGKSDDLVRNWSANGAAQGDNSVVRQTETLGWTDCGHNTWRTGTVLDPFGGSGTTLAVATGHSRNAIGIDLDVRNAELACDRIGPMFFHHTTVDELWPLDGAA